MASSAASYGAAHGPADAEQAYQADAAVPHTPERTEPLRTHWRAAGLLAVGALVGVAGYATRSGAGVTVASRAASAAELSASKSNRLQDGVTNVIGDESEPSNGGKSHTANVLFIMVDQARPDAFGAEGNGVAYTPNFDSIASEGVMFTNAYSSTPICTPARQAIITGRGPWNHGMRCYSDQVVPRSYTEQLGWLEMPSTMADLGYYTASIGKNHFGYNATTYEWFTHGFNEIYNYEGDLAEDRFTDDFTLMDDYNIWFNKTCTESGLYGHCDPLMTKPVDDVNAWYGGTYSYNESWHPTAWTGTLALDWLSKWKHEIDDGTAPFFLKVSFQRPHSPYDPPGRVLEFIKERASSGSDLTLDLIDDAHVASTTTDPNGDADAETSGYVTAWDQHFASSSSPTLCDMNNSDTYCGTATSYQVRNSRAHYYASLTFVDEQVGKILKRFREYGYEKNSLILFVADHGDSIGDHHLYRKGYPTEQVASIPLYMRWPESMNSVVSVARGHKSTKVVELRDIFPTVTAFAGTDIREYVDGSSLLDLIIDPSNATWRTWIDLELTDCGFNNSITWNALTDGEVKYVYWWYDATEHLFNLTADPYEQNNLAPLTEYASKLNWWRSVLINMFVDEDRGAQWYDHSGALTTEPTCWKKDYLENYPCYTNPAGTTACSTA